ncbi:hypothetical protein [Moorena sp. SIO3I6]|nr:hypothetical protein [Moorena sp. SIO3I6]
MGETPKTALHRCSLLPAPYSLKPRNLYLTPLKSAMNARCEYPKP